MQSHVALILAGWDSSDGKASTSNQKDVCSIPAQADIYRTGLGCSNTNTVQYTVDPQHTGPQQNGFWI